MSAGKAEMPADTRPRRGAGLWLAAGLATILAIVLLVCIYFTVQIIVNPEPIDKFTEMYILGPEGRADNYPSMLVIGENKTLIASVVNHENEEVYYNLAIRYNNSSAEKTAYTEFFVLQDNASWSQTFMIKPDLPGKKVKVEFQLYKNGDTGTPYRECYIWLNVSEPYKYVNTTKAGAAMAK